MSSRSAILAYSGLSIVLTWPLALGFWRDVPGDLGDSLLNMWILAWGAEHLPQVVTGGMSWAQFWDANIFHPSPLALSLSEHLFGPVLQILPVYWLTGNIILCYNLLFVSTFVLSAFGAYLLVWDLTGDRRAAFVAGLVFGFLPYRIASVPHLQVLSSQWMPFALFGLNRFVTTGSYRALAGGTAALVMQNWSCGYYLLYFAPFAPLFVVHRMWAHKTLADLRTWTSLAIAALVTLALTLPFLWPYTQAEQQFGLGRPFAEVVRFSADVWSYATAPENLWMFGRTLRFYPHPEGETFLGLVPWILALVAVIGLWRRERAAQRPEEGQTPLRRLLTWVLVLAVVAQLAAVFGAVSVGGFQVDLFGVAIRARSLDRMLWQTATAAVLLLVASRRARTIGARMARSPIAFFGVALILAMWLSLGPRPTSGTVNLSAFGLYGVLYDHVPGFTGVRVPARYAMIAGLFLAGLAGLGVREFLGGRGDKPNPPRWRLAVVAAVGVLVLLEGAGIPMEINRTWAGNEATPPARVFRSAEAPAVYARVAALPDGSAVTEFPFGDPAWEIRYVYYAAAHWKPITNGYSGSFPPDYQARVARFRRVTVDPEASWAALIDSGTTHVVVHTAAFANPADATAVATWLDAHGARVVETFEDGDALYTIR